MITAVDSTILLDVLIPDQTHGEQSARFLRQCLAEGPVVACAAVWAETAAMFDDARQFADVMHALTVSFSPMTHDAALRSSRSWQLYRQRGGRRARVIADFLIGAHAMEQADRLLTRDRGFYRDYFTKLRIIDPSA